jgi:hypothetical protein
LIRLIGAQRRFCFYEALLEAALLRKQRIEDSQSVLSARSTTSLIYYFAPPLLALFVTAHAPTPSLIRLIGSIPIYTQQPLLGEVLGLIPSFLFN